MNIFSERLQAVRKIMSDKGYDAVLISGSDPHCSEYPASRWKQVEWICGFTGESGDVVITMDHAGLWTDSRYFIQANEQLEGTGFELHKTRIPGEVSIPEWLAEIAFSDRKDNVIIAFDGLSQTVNSIETIRSAFQSSGRIYDNGEDVADAATFRFVDIPDFLDLLWLDRPAVPSNPIRLVGDEITGESESSKIQWLRGFIEDMDCNAILLSSLDEIAWMLNIRGSDVEYNPVVISYLVVTQDTVEWYVKKSGLINPELEGIYAQLRKKGTDIFLYDDIYMSFDLPETYGHKKLYLDPGSLNWHLASVIGDSSIDIVYGKSPVQLRKAVKNEIEVAGMKDAHIEDGIAMEKFLFWLNTMVSQGYAVSEKDASVKLDSLRSEIPGCVGNSFCTISAYGPSAALPHYVTPDEDSRLLEPHGLYLCDSGGQYLFGTTDLTRTIPLGPCTDLEMEDYTLVLKGHIGLASAVFPAGTPGCRIDYAARAPLWKFERNYGHGTGHGVGFFLNVHEGPQDIRQSLNPQPLLPGMITSDEPGLYREGMHGIRHESLLLCVEAGSNEFGSWLCFENLTLCHIDTSAVVRDLMDDEEIAWLNAYNEHVYRMLSPRLPEETASWLRRKTMPIA